MIPEDKVPESFKKKRQQGYIKRRTSCHHPGDGFKLFPVLPGLFKAEKNVKKAFMELVD